MIKKWGPPPFRSTYKLWIFLELLGTQVTSILLARTLDMMCTKHINNIEMLLQTLHCNTTATNHLQNVVQQTYLFFFNVYQQSRMIAPI